MLVLNCWLRDFLLSAVANRFELRCKPKQLMLLYYKICPCLIILLSLISRAYYIKKNFGRGETKSLVIRSGTRGRYVFVSLGYRTFMSICEVEVYVKRGRSFCKFFVSKMCKDCFREF